MFPIDPGGLAALLATAKKDGDYGDSMPIPEGARKEYVRFVRVLAGYEEAQRNYKLWDARIDAAKAELSNAIGREYPPARSSSIKWNTDDATFQLEKKAEPPKQPGWVAQVSPRSTRKMRSRSRRMKQEGKDTT